MRRGKHREVENKCIFLHLPRLQWLRVATVAGGLTLKVTFYSSEKVGKSRPKATLAFFVLYQYPNQVAAAPRRIIGS